MLTPKNIKARTAIEYFREGYYQKGEWLGKGAAALGLKGEIFNITSYENIVKGLSCDGSQKLFAREVDTSKRKAAVDCTFAAPKSVSLCALVGGDDRLVKAHQDAVKKVLHLMEQEYAQTRMMLDGETQEVVKTGNLVIAKYDHIETRELDPHLHSHCLVMNMTKLPNGEWYSHHYDAIFRDQKLLGMMYQHYLALEVQKLGYEIERRDHGQFEIKGYTEEQRLDFSKRRQQILARAGADGSWLERELAWKKTRKNKEHVSPEELKARWLEQAQALGIEIVQPSEPQPELESPEVNSKLVEDAIAHCSERQVAFRPQEIKKFILSESFPLDVTKIEPLLESNAELIRISEQQGIRYTTQAALQRELNTIRLMQQGQSQVPAVAQEKELQQHLTKTTLNEGQRAAVLMATTTTDLFVAWQGVAGAGKTYALNEFRRIATDKGYEIKGYAPSAQAAKVLGEEIGIDSNTVAGLLVSKQATQVEPNQIWIIDEAGLLSAKDAHRLLERATQEQARLILVGDIKQLSAVEAGNPFKSLQQAGIRTAYLTESQRQRTPELKLAIDLVAEAKIEQGFARLDAQNSIQEVNKDALVDAIATEYMAGTPESRAKTLVLAGTNAERLGITQAIRTRLKAEGSLGHSHTTGQLKAKDLTSVQKGYTHHFEVGDVVMPIRDYKRRGLVKGSLYSVIKKTQDSLSLQANDGTILDVDLNFKKAVYQGHRLEIAVGDRLRWTKNDRQLGRRNGQEFIVTAITGNSAQIQYLDGTQSETINLAQAQHLDYALVSTTYSSQGKTADRVLIAADSTIGKESFYVAVSRARYELKLYTEDKAYLLELAQQTKTKENPLDLLRRQVSSQMAVESPQDASVTARSVANLKKNRSKQEISSPTTNANSSYAAARPVKHHIKTPKQVKVSNQPVILHPSGKQTDLAAIVKATDRKLPSPPDWLAFGKRVHCQNQGWGKVEAILGARLVVKLDTGKQAVILDWPDAVKSKSVWPEPSEAFWTPSSVSQAPPNIEVEHWHELVESSVIHPKIAARNFLSLEHDMVEQAHEAWEYLFYSDKLERNNTGRLSLGTLKRYEHIESGGWWCGAGVDPRCFKDLEPGQKPKEKIWGCFKPNNPRENPEKPGKKIKYEHPLKADLSIFLLDVPDEVANRIYSKALVNPSQSDRTSGFWYCVWKYNLPITITEGAKKAACLLSQGHAAIGLPGIYAGYRSKDEQGNEIKARLHEELAVFATPEREIKFAFDYETKPKTLRNIEIAISRTGSLMERLGARVSVVRLPGPDKGVDDLIKMQGPLAYEKANGSALRLKVWRERNKEQQAPEELTKELSPEERVTRLKVKLASKLSRDEPSVKQEVVESISPTTSSSIPTSPQDQVLPRNDLDLTQIQETQIQENSYEQPDSQQQQSIKSADIGRRVGERFNPIQPAIRGVGAEPYQFATGTGELSQAISRRVELQAYERIAAAVAELSLSLANHQFSVTGTESKRAAITQFDAAVRAGINQQQTRSLIKSIADYIEQSTIQSHPALLDALKTLRESLTMLQSSNTKQAVKQLTTTLSDYKQQVVNQRQNLAELALQVREMPLPEVAPRLGLEPDRHDKHKWRGNGHIISINDQKFYDHLAQKGGYGAIDLVMHVQGQNFKQAVDWLSNGAAYIASEQRAVIPQQVTTRSTNPCKNGQASNSVPHDAPRDIQHTPGRFYQEKSNPSTNRQPFQPPAPDDLKWAGVRQYLVAVRSLPLAMVDELHRQGMIYADAKQNAVFLRRNEQGEITGANLRGTYKDSQFKGLATGSRKDQGWFSISHTQGQLERIVLVESAIDAISAAALARENTGTKFISTDGAGAVPIELLRQHQAAGVQVLVAYDADSAGEEMAQFVLEMLPGATRVRPTIGKDWNEQLIMGREALETKAAVQRMFQLIGNKRIMQPDGSWAFDATNWRFTENGDAITITEKQHNREIMRIEGNGTIVFNPTPAERTKLKDFRQDIAEQQRKQNQQEQGRRAKF